MIETTKLARRQFMHLLGFAPIAAPVALKEAAAASGVAAAVGSSGGVILGSGGVPGSAMSEREWVTERLRDLATDAGRQEIRREVSESALILDSDLAASRSMSPSVARQLQIERNIARRIAREHSWLNKSLARLVG